MCVSGKPVKADAALKLGLIDRIIVGDLLTGAVEFAREAASGVMPLRKTRERTEKLERDPQIFEDGLDLARKTRRNMVAPLTVVEAIKAATELDFEAGCERERKLVRERLRSDECRALIHAFFAERAVSKIADIPIAETSKATQHLPIRKVAIVGAGTMGSGIAMACANAGLSVVLKDVDQMALERGMAAIAKNYESSVKKGRMTEEVAGQRIDSIQTRTDYEGFEEADLILEAAFESMELKKRLFAEIDGVAKEGCVLATNTSTLDIDEIAAVTRRPEMVIGLHFFSPAHIMRLLEIVRGAKTSKPVVATALALAKKLSKVGVVVGNCRGFVGNRMMLPYMREAQFLVEEGSTPPRSTLLCMISAWPWEFSPSTIWAGSTWVGGFARNRSICSSRANASALVVDKLYEMGRLGQKTGKGWYKYEDGRTPVADPEVEALIEKTAREAGIERRAILEDEITDRCIYTLVNEGARILDEGFAQRAADIDVIYMTGYGFPAYRGGPMWYADTVGLKKVYERVSEFRRRFGEQWEPAPLLQVWRRKAKRSRRSMLRGLMLRGSHEGP